MPKDLSSISSLDRVNIPADTRKLAQDQMKFVEAIADAIWSITEQFGSRRRAAKSVPSYSMQKIGRKAPAG
jgi:hypothetical protein